MPQYRWTWPDPLRTHSDAPIQQGDTFEPTDAERRAFADRMERVSDESDAEGDSPDEATDGTDGELTPETIADALDRGACPWCDGYEGEHVGQHASSAHPDEWDAYAGE